MNFCLERSEQTLHLSLNPSVNTHSGNANSFHVALMKCPRPRHGGGTPYRGELEGDGLVANVFPIQCRDLDM